MHFERAGFPMNYEIHEGLVPMDTVFLHGNLASNAWWQPAVGEWTARKKPGLKGRLILAEWRGCGGSNGTAFPDSLETLANDYVELLQSLSVAKANLVAHSTGGLIGLHAMHARPELFHRAFLLDSVSASGVQFGPEMYAAFTEMSRNKELCAMVMMGTVHETAAPESLRARLIDDAFNVHPSIWHGVPKLLHTADFRDRLAGVPHPTLVLHGSEDKLLPIEGSEALAKGLPQGRFHKIPGRGHSTNVENPALFVDMANEFLFG